jgi:NitT/TauT family transport system permease protein
MAEGSKRASRKLPGKLLWFVLLLLLWEAAARFSGVSPLLLPPLSSIGAHLLRGILSGSLLASTGYSLLLIAVSMIIGTFLALLLSVGAYFTRPLTDLADLLTAIGHPIPGIALLPLVILWFGIGETAVAVIIIHSVLWPMTVSIRTGFSQTPPHYLQISRNYELRRSTLLFSVLLPASLPYAVSGLRISWARAWRAVISAEMVFGAMGGGGGLGWYLYNRRVFMDTPGLFAGILMLIAMGMLFENLLFRGIERRTLTRWSVS